MKIKNALVYDETGFVEKNIDMENGLFSDGGSDFEEYDARGYYAIPGLTDLHFHGCDGYDFCNHTVEALDHITKYEATAGITTICPATMTLPFEELQQIACVTAQYQNDNGSTICGINLEGPFLSETKKGAQNSAYLRKADFSFFEELQKKSNGLIKLITVAPEIPENMDFIQKASSQIRISLGHSSADYNTAKSAFAAGAKHVTHLFNAMSPFGHRDPGIIGAAFDSPEVYVELIGDGVHIHPCMIRATFSIFTRERIVLVSDSMEATGLANGSYQLGGQKVVVNGPEARLANHTIAGSVSNLMDCVRYLVKEVGLPLADIIYCAAVNPAKAIGIYDRYGSITSGKIANLVLLDSELKVVKVFLNGKELKP